MPKLESPGTRTLAPPITPTEFITTRRLLQDALTLLPALPPTIDTIVGIARSGLIGASALAVHLHLPLYSTTRETGIVALGGGYRTRVWEPQEPQHILLFDDALGQNQEMKAAHQRVRDKWPNAKLTKAVVYCNPEHNGAVDYCHAFYLGRHYSEWGLYNNGIGISVLSDLDGLVCADCPDIDNDDGPRYRVWMHDVAPKYYPRCLPLYTIITARHEKYRDLTQEWLDRHRMRVAKVIMRDWDYQGHVSHDEQVGAWKAEMYRQSGLEAMFESTEAQCEIIHQLTGRTVICPPIARVWPGVK